MAGNKKFWMTRWLAWLQIFCAASTSAEVADKCPSFVSDWSEVENGWVFMSGADAAIRLGIFSCFLAALASAAFFLLRRSKRQWPKYLPAAFGVVIALLTAVSFLPQDDPCSEYFMMREIPPHLFWIEIGFKAVTIAAPVLLTALLIKKSRRAPAFQKPIDLSD